MTDASERDKPSFNEVIRSAREAARLSQEEVAAVARTTQSTYSRFENGQGSLEIDALVRIRDFINKHPRRLGIPLAVLAYPELHSTVRTGKTLIEQIAEELQVFAKHKRQRDEEKKRKELVEEAGLLEAIAAKVPGLEAENTALKIKVAKLEQTIRRLRKGAK